MGLTYYSNLIDLPIYSNERSSSSEVYSKNIYANLANTRSSNRTCSSVYENIQLNSASSSTSSPIYMNLNTLNEQISSLPPVDLETNVLVQCSSTSSKEETIEKFEVNIVSCSNGKNDSNRMKMPRIPSSSRRRRTLNRPRRYRCRSSTPFRTLMQSNATRRQQAKPPMISHSHRPHKSVTNQLYQTIFDHRESTEQVKEIFFDAESIEEPRPTTSHRKSSSSTLVSLTNTIISSETLSSDGPPPSSNIALGLHQKDVEFIHDILQGDHRAANRIAALKQAYLRAANNRQEQLKINPLVRGNEKEKKKINRKPSVIASKIRDELEKYDELPVNPDSFSDDETYSTNDNYRYYHRRLPEIPSTTHRIIDFISTLKRQLQHNFQKIRSRILLEMMANPPRKRPYHPRSNIRPRSSSHYSPEHSYPSHRQGYSRSHSNISRMSEKYSSNRPRTFRVTAHQRGRRMQH